MGRAISELGSAAMRNFGFSCEPVPPPDFNTLMLGRKHTLCKECLPLILVTGSMLETERLRKSTDEMLLYFMPTSIGSCRFCQYYIFLQRLIEKKRIPNLTMLTFSSGNSFAGIGTKNIITLVKSLIVADVMDDIRNAICVLAADPDSAIETYNRQMQKIAECIQDRPSALYGVLRRVASTLRSVKLRHPLAQAKKVLLAGEIYVRKEEFSSHGVVDRLMRHGIVVKRAPIIEYLHYTDSLTVRESSYSSKTGFRDRLEISVRNLLKRRFEARIKRILSQSGLYEFETVDLEKILSLGSRFINRSFTGEMILVIGSFFKEIARHVHGVISIGPFACLPTRLIEAILSQECRIVGNDRLKGMHGIDHLGQFATLPFLSVESDGNPFPQILQSKLEAFCLQVDRLHQELSHG
jgi:predicted nucleotide-binding protein (sugar kinase/HSP70/actin superfamily)